MNSTNNPRVFRRLLFSALFGLFIQCFSIVALAAEVEIPDASLKSAIREALGKSDPVGNLTEQDMLSLTNLSAVNRTVRTLQGLGAARNLTRLDLRANRLTNLILPPELTRLVTLDLSENALTHLVLPAELTRLSILALHSGTAPTFTLSGEAPNLRYLYLDGNGLTSLVLSADLRQLDSLNLSGNYLSELSFLNKFTTLTWLELGNSPLLSHLRVPSGLTNLTTLNLSRSWLRSLTPEWGQIS